MRVVHALRKFAGLVDGSTFCDAFAEAEQVLDQFPQQDPENAEYLQYLIDTRELLISALRAAVDQGGAYSRWEFWAGNTETLTQIARGDVVDGYLQLPEGEWQPKQVCGQPIELRTPRGDVDLEWGLPHSTDFSREGTHVAYKIRGVDGCTIGFVDPRADRGTREAHCKSADVPRAFAAPKERAQVRAADRVKQVRRGQIRVATVPSMRGLPAEREAGEARGL